MTPPTPPMMPSATRSFTHPSGIYSLTVSPIHVTRLSIHSIGYDPRVNVAQNMNVITARKIGNPNSLFVTMVSMMCVELTRACSSDFSSVSARAPDMKPYFSSAMAAVRSVSG